jgi:3-hydroxyacyl-CoA dehydrogenase
VIKSKPSPLYLSEFKENIQVGTLEDDLSLIKDADWIIEAVIERLDIKLDLFARVDELRQLGSLITSNTSGLPIRAMIAERSDDFKKHFCGTHFFNPPRYLPLLEIIPSPDTAPEVIDFLMHYGDLHVGKTTVLAKDTPAFIANRVGIYSIMVIFHLMNEMGLTVTQVDKLTGPVIGHPKSATFRTCDVVGIDTLVKVASDMHEHCPEDEQREIFQIPDYVNQKGEQGTTILALNLQSLEYEPREKVSFATLEATKSIDPLKERLPVLLQGQDNAADFYRQFFYKLFAYVSFRVPEIADRLHQIDDAIKAGFGWEIGPFEQWDLHGVKSTVDSMSKAGIEVAPWVRDMLASGQETFYSSKGGKLYCFDQNAKDQVEVPGKDGIIILDNFREENKVWGNAGATLLDIGDGILNLEFHSKMNSMGAEVVEGINHAIKEAEENFSGLVIGNEGANFSAGANLAMMYMWAAEQEFDELDLAIRTFQNTMMRARYSSIPVVIAPHGLTLGGGCELALHGDHVQAAAETYMGLVEVGVGLIPAGGGTKEMVARAADAYYEGDPQIPNLQNYFLAIATAKVSTSAHEAFENMVLLKGRDGISINRSRLITDAKRAALELAKAGYEQPLPKMIKVLGRAAIGAFYTGANAFKKARYISEHDEKISKKLAFVMGGGDLSRPTEVSEQYLLDLEREAFLSLLGEQKTLERIQSVLTTGKPLRN